MFLNNDAPIPTTLRPTPTRLLKPLFPMFEQCVLLIPDVEGAKSLRQERQRAASRKAKAREGKKKNRGPAPPPEESSSSEEEEEEVVDSSSGEEEESD